MRSTTHAGDAEALPGAKVNMAVGSPTIASAPMVPVAWVSALSPIGGQFRGIIP
jgi:hypothetical protein